MISSGQEVISKGWFSTAVLSNTSWNPSTAMTSCLSCFPIKMLGVVTCISSDKFRSMKENLGYAADALEAKLSTVLSCVTFKQVDMFKARYTLKRGLEVSNTFTVSRDLFYYSLSIKEATYHLCVKTFCWVSKPLVKTGRRNVQVLLLESYSSSFSVKVVSFSWLVQLATRGSFN